MKRLLLIGLLLSSMGAIAQQNINITSTHWIKTSSTNIKKAIRRTIPSDLGGKIPYNNNASRKLVSPATSSWSRSLSATEDTIGTTEYDLQTNGSISNRMVYNSDGTISAVWTFSPDETTGYPNRGTGYNYFDGTSWGPIPTTRIETGEGSYRTGFCDVGDLSNGGEVVIAHGIQTSGVNLGILYTSRPVKGTGSWDVNDTLLGKPPGDSINYWPKMAIGGVDGLTIHAIWRGGSEYRKISGQSGPIYYSRSTDGGYTWPVLESILPPIDSDFYYGFSDDNYTIDARDSVVAIVVGGQATDVVLLKSTDNGNTWTKTVVASFAIPMYDPATMTTDTTNTPGVVDTLLSCSGDPNVVLDNNNVAHVFFSVVNVTQAHPGVDSIFYFPYTDGLFYWNENMTTTGPKEIAYAPRLNGDSMVTLARPSNNGGACYSTSDDWSFGLYGAGITEKPSAGVDANNNIYLCYQTVDENSDTLTWGRDYKHVYLIKSTDGGNTWTNPDSAFDVVATTQPIQNIDLEGVYGCMAKHIDDKIRIIYQRDDAPGLLLGASDCDVSNNANNPLNDIIYVDIDTSFTVGIPELTDKTYGAILSPNFPNPATASTQFNLTLSTPLNVQLNVTDMLGQSVYTENKGKLGAGIHTVTLNTSYLSGGVYFYTVTAGDQQLTGKMIVE